jgi:uncharacterized membrane protein
MESHAKLAGHAIHPMLIVLPLGLLATSVIFDILFKVTGEAALGTAAFYDIAAGIIGGLVAALFGLIDWLHIPENTRAKGIGLLHGVGNVVIVLLFAVSWLTRSGTTGHLPTDLGFVLEIIGVLLALVTGWLGGELVERLGVSVDPGAHLDAPNSLSGQPAATRERADLRR